MKKLSAYWWCQIGGWSSYVLINTFFYFTIRTKPSPHFFSSVLLDAFVGVVITHLMRILIRKANLVNLDLRRQIISMFLTTLVFAITFSIVIMRADEVFNLESDMWKEYTFWNKVMRASFGYFLFLLIWNFIYFTYHYVEKTRKEKLDKVRLESLVKELELKTIKSHINPHFIFNALNSIRALVDENPERARTAITELSNILRTLVENAIKHGISRQISGGKIKIISDFKDNHHELIVQNTGTLESENNTEGFGIVSTQNRLKLLYGGKADFAIRNVNGNMVEAKVVMPVTIL